MAEEAKAYSGVVLLDLGPPCGTCQDLFSCKRSLDPTNATKALYLYFSTIQDEALRKDLTKQTTKRIN